MLDFSYIDSFLSKFSYKENLKSDILREKAIEENIPIIRDDFARFLEFLMLVKKPKNILEIGTAIGYSAFTMLSSSNAKITSVDIDDKNQSFAAGFFEKENLLDRLTLINADAYDFLCKNKTSLSDFDFFFIDGPKARYLDYFKLIEPYLKDEAIILFDNVFYLGLVTGRRKLRRNGTIARNMRELLDYISVKDELHSHLLKLGDGAFLVYKKGKTRWMIQKQK